LGQPVFALKNASYGAIFDALGRVIMRTTVTIDDELLETAKEYTGIEETSALMREALKSLIAREAGRRLARMGGTKPHLEDIPRRRQEPE
jgi:Arc/MetJ family transcription regulator